MEELLQSVDLSRTDVQEGKGRRGRWVGSCPKQKCPKIEISKEKKRLIWLINLEALNPRLGSSLWGSLASLGCCKTHSSEWDV
jgi:hypothetical protein